MCVSVIESAQKIDTTSWREFKSASVWRHQSRHAYDVVTSERFFFIRMSESAGQSHERKMNVSRKKDTLKYVEKIRINKTIKSKLSNGYKTNLKILKYTLSAKRR